MEILNLKSDSFESNMSTELTNHVEENAGQTTTWSMEILPHNISNLTLIPDFVNEVYITMIPGASCRETIQTAHQIQAVGKQAVPHIAGRSFKGVEELSACLSELQETGIDRALLIGGGQSEPAGDITCVMDMLKTGLFAKYGINAFDFAGHPEGNPDDPNSEAHLLEKLLWTEERGIPARIVTQWCFDSDGTNDWISGLREKGIRNPIHIGIPGPSTMKTLLSFAKVCGVQASAQVLRKQGLNISKLMFVNKPDKIISELRGYDKLHLYPFGGIAKSADWLNEWRRINC